MMSRPQGLGQSRELSRFNDSCPFCRTTAMAPSAQFRRQATITGFFRSLPTTVPCRPIDRCERQRDVAEVADPADVRCRQIGSKRRQCYTPRHVTHAIEPFRRKLHRICIDHHSACDRHALDLADRGRQHSRVCQRLRSTLVTVWPTKPLAARASRYLVAVSRDTCKSRCKKSILVYGCVNRLLIKSWL